MTRAIVTDPDPTEIGAALEDDGATVTRVTRPITAATLEGAGIADADLFVLTDAEEATAIPLARERNSDVRIVVYGTENLPEFAGHQADLVITPETLDQDIVVEELLDTVS